MLAARGDHQALRAVWKRSANLAVAGVAFAGILLCAVIIGLNRAAHPFAGRLLPVGATALLVFGTCCSQVIQGFAAYLRAQKREQLMPAGVLSSFACGALTWVLGRSSTGSTGVSLAYAVGMGLVGLPIALRIWSRATRTEFRS
jgi:hypothetical protein